MEDPVSEISSVIHKLTQGSPSIQQRTLQRYFTPSASFTHPFCRTGSFDLTSSVGDGFVAQFLKEGGLIGAINSRGLIGGIYRWYKIMSPKIDLEVDGAAFDDKSLTLYVSIHQTFRIWLVPGFSAPVKLVTVLTLEPHYSSPSAAASHSPRLSSSSISDSPSSPTVVSYGSSRSPKKTKYLITSQNDLYQTTEFFKFFSIFRLLWSGLLVWQFFATAMCVLGQAVFRPFVWWEESQGSQKELRRSSNGNGNYNQHSNGVNGHSSTGALLNNNNGGSFDGHSGGEESGGGRNTPPPPSLSTERTRARGNGKRSPTGARNGKPTPRIRSSGGGGGP